MSAGEASPATTPRRFPVPPGWFWLSFAVTLGANQVAGVAAEESIALMSRVSDFAEAVRAHSLPFMDYWTGVAYPTVIGFLYWYLRPVLCWFQDGGVQPAPLVVQRRVVSAPLVYAVAGLLGWVAGIPLFIGITIGSFGRWAPELASQHIFTPLINGYLAATICYFVVDRIYRSAVYPKVFPEGGLTTVPGAFVLGVRGRFFQLLLALSFIPMFVMLGLTRAAEVRLVRGLDPSALLHELTSASQATFVVYVLVGGVLAALVTRSVTKSLEEAADALRRVQRGDLDVRVRVDSADEIGVLEDGVNQMVTALRDRERILQTFGRVVEPGVRDRLLGGQAGQGGEKRHATVLFCDLRGFTALSEALGAEEAVATVNDFFTVTTAWVRECGGIVDKFIGDAALVVFGLLDEDRERSGAEKSAVAGLRCALGLEEKLRELNEKRRLAGKSDLTVTIAIHSGEVVAGVIGSPDRHEYTVVGDTVNVAARLQQAAKDYGGIVASGETCSLARDGGLDVPVRTTDSVTLRGRREPVVLHGIGGAAGDAELLSAAP
ncbi:MAG: adenylate/guanylate cyclase domain-containing protein [Candidatus Binatia bacterium]